MGKEAKLLKSHWLYANGIQEVEGSIPFGSTFHLNHSKEENIQSTTSNRSSSIEFTFADTGEKEEIL